MRKQSKAIVLAILGWMGTAAIPFVMANWYSEAFVHVADSIFANVKPTGIALTLVLGAILSTAIGGFLIYLWLRTSIEHLPKKYKFERWSTVGQRPVSRGVRLCITIFEC